MNILITGARGFIGSNFRRQFALKYVCHTFSFSKQSFNELILDNIEVIVHFAAVVHQPNAHKEDYINSNVVKTLEFAKKAKKSGVKHFVFISTIAVYDITLTLLKEDSLINPITLYGKSKFEAEKQLMELIEDTFKVSIIRTPMVYGAYAPGNIDSLIKLIDKFSILPFGKIENQRSFVFVGNLCALIDCVIQKNKSGIFIASDDESLSTTKLIRLIAIAKDKKICLLQIKFFEHILRWIKPSVWRRLFGSLVIDNSQTKLILNFKNPYSVEEGIRLMIEGEKL